MFSARGKDKRIILFSVASGGFYQDHFKRLANTKELPGITQITMNPKHLLRKYCDQMIILPDVKGLSQSHSAVMENMTFMMLIDMLLATLYERRSQTVGNDARLLDAVHEDRKSEQIGSAVMETMLCK